MPIVYSIVAFLFYRIASVALFDSPVTILACLIASFVGTFVLLVYCNYVSIALGKLAFARSVTGSTTQTWEILLFPTVVLLAVNFVQFYLVSLGFSEKFYEYVSNFGRRRDLIEQPMTWFALISILPPLAYASLLISHLKVAPISKSEAEPMEVERKRKNRDL
jgi:hypothetical protein